MRERGGWRERDSERERESGGKRGRVSEEEGERECKEREGNKY